MGKSFSSNNTIDELKWDIVHSRGRKQDGLVKYLSCRDSLENREVAEKFTRCLTNSGHNYLKRLENVKNLVFEKGYESFSNEDLSYFSELLGNTRKCVEASVQKKGKQIVSTQSVLARINGLRSNLENVLNGRKEKQRVMGLKSEMKQRINSGFYKSGGIAVMGLRAEVRQYQVRKERQEKAKEEWKKEHPYLDFFQRNKRKIGVAAAGLVLGVASLAVRDGLRDGKSNIPVYASIQRVEEKKVEVRNVSLIDVSQTRKKKQKGSYVVNLVNPNIEVYAPDRVESSLVKEVDYDSEIDYELISSGDNLEGKVESRLVEEQKKPGVFSRAKQSLFNAGKNAGKGIGRRLARLENVGINFADGLMRAYDSGMERIARINYENEKTENEYKSSVVNPAPVVVENKEIDEDNKTKSEADYIHKKYPFVLRITRSEAFVNEEFYLFGKRVKSPCKTRDIRESRSFMAMGKLPDILPEDFNDRIEIAKVYITDISANPDKSGRRVSGIELTGKQWKERKEHVPAFGSFR
ncbi:MAG: hypothetical protein ABH840_03730 [Nanoarchaeota archaeon]